MDSRLDGVLRVAQEQSQAQEMMQAALQATLQNPHTIHRHRAHSISVTQEGSSRTILVALPTGVRLDIEMNQHIAGQIARNLLAPDVKQKDAA